MFALIYIFSVGIIIVSAVVSVPINNIDNDDNDDILETIELMNQFYDSSNNSDDSE